MEKTDVRAVTKYFRLKGLKAKEIKSEADSILGESSSHTIMKCWVAEFKIGSTSTEDELVVQNSINTIDTVSILHLGIDTWYCYWNSDQKCQK